MRRLILPKEVSAAIGSLHLSRGAMVALLVNLRFELEHNADNYRSLRASAHPDLYFWFEWIVKDQGRLRSFRFTVDDASAADHLFAVAVEEIL